MTSNNTPVGRSVSMLPSLVQLSIGTIKDERPSKTARTEPKEENLSELIFKESVKIARSDDARALFFGTQEAQYSLREINDATVLKNFIDFLEDKKTESAVAYFEGVFEHAETIVPPQMNKSYDFTPEDLSDFANIMTDVESEVQIVDEVKKGRLDRTQALADDFVENLHSKIRKKFPTFYTKALEAGMQHMDGAKSDPFLHLLIQPDINTSAYLSDKLSGEIHMDDCIDPGDDTSLETTYCLGKNNTRNIASITAFCLELTKNNDGPYKFEHTVKDETCGTVFYKNVPILKKQFIEEFISLQHPESTPETKKEISLLIRTLFQVSTSNVLDLKLRGSSSDHLPYGITEYKLKAGEWTKDNYHFFHTSPNIPSATNASSTYWRFFLVSIPQMKFPHEKKFKDVKINDKKFDLTITFRGF